ncbi:phytanoyl-CoA dioxygenase family protein [Mucilaginibacter gotjawali]|uniref:Ectoine hydroxylase-related dioxygenase (Phytanoyl-CoA dioxygenase family) n=2 Tax=Mucilaginibacter gotjawali TaxID=1550579 RepID=A0A839SE37_9SPHI|nr:phytanoyl-CoA dioxygenase family protein [Mucilaginibacter gotjawali]MBB3056046.1 ectoine hydroxylase-related dioxygenase (phytanoyl-CoA dioxygenase family) [Mucilaginibacter gotjawali]BAU53617.1 phytanoyl-CoA dioxygenase PhyH [Mucilaginibacter gotjawali]
MEVSINQRQQIADSGFSVFEDIYTIDEINSIGAILNKADRSEKTFRQTADLFAIRQFLKVLPEVKPLVFNQNLRSVIDALFGNDYFVVKSIYFDKPEKSNWFVAWHQDLTISVDKKADVPGYSAWTVKHDQFSVQPAVEILKDIFTIRIHLDDTDGNNGALKVIPGSHLKGIYRAEEIVWNSEAPITCNVKSGGIMIMRPLLMHASDRTTSNKTRRVIHIEFSRDKLPLGLNWAEKETTTP